MKPAIPLTDPRFKYTNSASTDLRATFARVREQQQKATKVVPIRKGAK